MSSSGRSKWKSVTRTDFNFSGTAPGLAGLGEFDGVVEGGLNGGLICWYGGGPGDSDTREGLGDEEAVPGTGFPGAVRMDVEGSDGGIDELGQLDDAGFGDHGRASGAVGGDGAVVAGKVGTLQVAQAGSAITGTGAADSDEAEALDGAGDQFAVEAAADEDGHAMVAKAPRRGQQAAVPKGIDRGWRHVIAGKSAGVGDVFVAKGNPKAADNGARDARNDGEDDALLQGESLGHEDEFTCVPAADEGNGLLPSQRDIV